MIYKTLDTIPYKIFQLIDQTGDISLLTTDQEYDLEYLNKIWEELYNKHLEINNSSENKRVFKISKTIDELLAIHKVIVFSCDVLQYEYNQDLFDIITNRGFTLSLNNTEEYHNDLIKISKQSKDYILQAERYKQMLPKIENTENNQSQYDIDDILGYFSSILGYNIGKHNEITYKEYHAHKKSVNMKIESYNKLKEKNNGKS